jgi:HK97 family phage portal protein
VSLVFRRAGMRARRDFTGVPDAASLIPPRNRGAGTPGGVLVTNDSALRHSAVWAALRLRADLMMTFPVDVLREVVWPDGTRTQVEMPRPPILTDPGGTEQNYLDWMWATQHDLDKTGNTIGLIVERSAIATPYFPEGLPARLEMAPIEACSVVQYKGERYYRINGKLHPPRNVYHERQYPINGLPVGLSPIVYAAWSIGEYLAMQQYGLDWFAGGAVPKARMRNTAKRLGPDERALAKQWYRDTIESGDVLVTGNDWEYDMIQAESAGMEWIEARRYGLGDIARFFSVPADLIEAAVSAGGNITYANISQRNLQLLIMNLQAPVTRRETKLSTLLPRPRFVKLNTDALLRMDPQTRAQILDMQLKNRTRTNSEARAYDNLPPLTEAQIKEMNTIYGPPPGTGAPPRQPAVEQPADEPVRAQAWLGRVVDLDDFRENRPAIEGAPDHGE